jgi:hypothetical protein
MGQFYIDRETSYITNIFRQTDPKIALCTKNTIGNLLTHKKTPPLIYTHNLEHTNFPAPIATKLMSDRPVGDSPRDTKNTKPPSETITKPKTSQNTLMKKAILSAL